MARRRRRKREDEGAIELLLTAAHQSVIVGFIAAAIALVIGFVLRSQPRALFGMGGLIGTLLLWVSGLLVLVALIGLVARKAAKPLPPSPPLQPAGGRSESMLRPGELAFYAPLREIVAGRFEIHIKASLVDVLQCRDHPQFAKIARMHVDFLLCDPQTLRPRLAIELDDRSHRGRRGARADRRKDELLHGAGIPLLRQKCCAAYGVQDLRERIDRATQPSTAEDR